MKRMLKRIFPFIGWFESYGLKSLRIDLVAGLTVALVLIPQSMAYAQLAGLPAYYGLYASFLPPMLASLFGSSRQLATGPVAVVSLMTAATLAPMATAGSEGYIAYAILLALSVGLFQFLLGVLRLGLVVNFLSHPVVNGFTNAAAIIIATSQLSKLFGVHVDSAEHHYETIIRVVQAALHFTHWPTLVMGVAAFALMYGIKKLDQRIPYVLVAVVLATLVAWAVGYEHNVKVPLSSIESGTIRGQVERFNECMSRIDELALERTAVNEELERQMEKSGPHSREVLDLEHRHAVVEAGLHDSSEQAASIRETLSSTLLAGVVENGKDMVFVTGDEVSRSETDGRTWRLKVGNKPLDVKALTVIGGGDVVGVIPRGLPSIGMPHLDLKMILRLLPFAAIISLLGFMEAISIAKAMAAKTGQKLDPNQELIGQGLANMAGCLAQSYPTSGSFSRSAVNLQAGAVSGLSSVFTSAAVVVVLLLFTPLLYHLPQSVLASVIMMAVLGLLNVSGFIHAWKAQWYDGAISIISFLATLAFAPHLDRGIMIGVVLSLLVFLYKSMRPKVATLSLYDRHLRDAARYKLNECQHVAVVRFDGPLFFANASYLEDKIGEHMETKPNLKSILVVGHGINDMDASGEEALSLLVDRVRSAGFGIFFCGLNEAVMAVLKRTHLLEKIGQENIFHTLPDAIEVIHPRAHADPMEGICPLTAESFIEPRAEAIKPPKEDMQSCQ